MLSSMSLSGPVNPNITPEHQPCKNKKKSSFFSRLLCATLAVGSALKQGICSTDTKIARVGFDVLSTYTSHYQTSAVVGLSFLTGAASAQGGVNISLENGGNSTDNPSTFDWGDIYPRLKNAWQGSPIYGHPQRTIAEFPQAIDFNCRPSLLALGDAWAAFGVGSDFNSIVGTFFDGLDSKVQPRKVIIYQSPVTKVFGPKSVIFSESEIMVAWSQNSGANGLTIVGQKVSKSGELLGPSKVLVDNEEGHQLLRDMVKHPEGGVVLVWESFSTNNATTSIENLSLSSFHWGCGISLQVFDEELNATGSAVVWQEENEPTRDAQGYAFPRLAVLKSRDLVLCYADSKTWQTKHQLFSANLEPIGDEHTSTYRNFRAMPALAAVKGGGFAKAWHGYTVYAIEAYIQLYDASGDHSKGAVGLDTRGLDRTGYPEIVATDDGGAAIVMQTALGIIFSRLNSDGNLEKTNHRLDAMHASSSMFPTLAITRQNEGFIALSCWLENNSTKTSVLKCRTFSYYDTLDETYTTDFALRPVKSQREAPLNRSAIAAGVVGGLYMIAFAVAGCCVVNHQLKMRKLKRSNEAAEFQGIPLKKTSRDPLLGTSDLSTPSPSDRSAYLPTSVVPQNA